MEIFGIGIDVVEVDRIGSAIERHGEAFLARVFTAAEREYCGAKKQSTLHFAARFAGKEAVSKAFGTGIGANASLRDIEILNDAAGAPQVQLSGAAGRFAEAQGITKVRISLTHARDYAAANALAIC